MKQVKEDRYTFKGSNRSWYFEWLSPLMAKERFCFSFHYLFDLWFYVPVNNYGHVEMVSEPNHAIPGLAS